MHDFLRPTAKRANSPGLPEKGAALFGEKERQTTGAACFPKGMCAPNLSCRDAVRDQEVVGSNPVASTKIRRKDVSLRRFCFEWRGWAAALGLSNKRALIQGSRKRAKQFCGKRRSGGEYRTEAQRPFDKQSLLRRGSGPRGQSFRQRRKSRRLDHAKGS